MNSEESNVACCGSCTLFSDQDVNGKGLCEFNQQPVGDDDSYHDRLPKIEWCINYAIYDYFCMNDLLVWR